MKHPVLGALRGRLCDSSAFLLNFVVDMSALLSSLPKIHNSNRIQTPTSRTSYERVRLM